MAGLSLVTGASGFAGSHLVDHLLGSEPSVAAWSSGGRPHRSDDPRVQWRAIDILDRQAVEQAIADLRPATVYHCAGYASVSSAPDNPGRAMQVNALGTHHLLEAIRGFGLNCSVLVTGSALVYRQSMEALDENAPIGPAGPYAVSKLAQEIRALQETQVSVVLARSFNHAGPRQSDEYATSSHARQIAEVEAGLRSAVRVGNLDSQRDITDVRDVVRAYRRLARDGQVRRPYNVCSGRAYRIGDLLDRLISLARIKVPVERDELRMRPSDNPVVKGDGSRIARELGWTPAIPIEQTLHDLLEYWRKRITPTAA